MLEIQVFATGGKIRGEGASCVEESLREKNRGCFGRERTKHFFRVKPERETRGVERVCFLCCGEEVGYDLQRRESFF